MRIGVMGIPGVEKTKFAKGLAKEFNLKLVDSYVQRIQRATDLALGPWASYGENFMIAGERMKREYLAGDEARITVGTILDTISYAAVKTDLALQSTPNEIRAAQAAAQGALSGLSLIYSETWDYHITFFLPHATEGKRSWNDTLDEGHRVVIDSYHPPFTYILDGTTEERIKIAKEIIHLGQDNQESTAAEATPSEADEQAI